MPTPDTGPRWRENTAKGVSNRSAWTELWAARDLVRYFALRDLKLRYRQTFLGIIWVLVQPIASVVIFTVVFNRLAGVHSEGIPYPLFALTGMVTWTYFASVVVSASNVLVVNANLVTKVYFPRIAAPAASLIPAAVDLGASLLLTGALAVYYGSFSGWPLLAIPLWFLLLAMTALGLSLWLSALNVRYRDIQLTITPGLQLWFFASPVAYPSSLLPGWTEYLYAVNPMVGVINLGRWSLLGGPWPGWPLAVSVTVSVLLILSGISYFQRAQRSFADVI